MRSTLLFPFLLPTHPDGRELRDPSEDGLGIERWFLSVCDAKFEGGLPSRAQRVGDYEDSKRREEKEQEEESMRQ